MQPDSPAHDLAQILRAENDALRRGDPAAAAAFSGRKLAAANRLPAAGQDPELVDELRALAAENAALLEQAIDIQGQIITLLARAAAQSAPPALRYGAEGRALPRDPSLSIIRQA